MQYARLGESGLVVSRLCFGAMTFGRDPKMPLIYKVEKRSAELMVRSCLEAGVNFFDTADGYAGGQSEEMLGALLAPHRRDVVVATKVGFRTGEPITQAGLGRRHILDSCERSLRRLGMDHVDLYLVHKEDPFTPLEETLEALDSLVRRGLVRYLGFSNWSAWRAAKALELQKANGWARFTSGQMYYSLVGRDVEHEVVPFLLHAGLSMTVWSPLAGGFLSGKYTPENLKQEGSRLSGFEFLPIDYPSGFRAVEAMRRVAAARGASVAQVALAWLLAKPAVASVIVGATKTSQLDDNLKAAGVTLDADDVATLDALTAPEARYPAWFNSNLVDPRHKAELDRR